MGWEAALEAQPRRRRRRCSASAATSTSRSTSRRPAACCAPPWRTTPRRSIDERREARMLLAILAHVTRDFAEAERLVKEALAARARPGRAAAAAVRAGPHLRLLRPAGGGRRDLRGDRAPVPAEPDGAEGQGDAHQPARPAASPFAAGRSGRCGRRLWRIAARTWKCRSNGRPGTRRRELRVGQPRHARA